MLRSVAATPDGGGLDTLWPVGAPGRYEVTAGYVTLPVTGATNPCAGASALRTATFTVSDDGGTGPRWFWVVAGEHSRCSSSRWSCCCWYADDAGRQPPPWPWCCWWPSVRTSAVVPGRRGPTTASTRTPVCRSAASTSRLLSTAAWPASRYPAATRPACCPGCATRRVPACGSSRPLVAPARSRRRTAPTAGLLDRHVEPDLHRPVRRRGGPRPLRRALPRAEPRRRHLPQRRPAGRVRRHRHPYRRGEGDARGEPLPGGEGLPPRTEYDGRRCRRTSTSARSRPRRHRRRRDR
ncbi:hypothetical protein V2I01_21605 [Micromonospora sp. BRA006-A]|nr:hypothetical protein [Micromonospora sp. BRA006-A]